MFREEDESGEGVGDELRQVWERDVEYLKVTPEFVYFHCSKSGSCTHTQMFVGEKCTYILICACMNTVYKFHRCRIIKPRE